MCQRGIDCILGTYAPDGPAHTKFDYLGFALTEQVLCANNEILDLVAPEGKSTRTDVQDYVWSQTCQHHGFILLGGRQLCPHNVQLPGQGSGARRADGRRAAKLTGPVLITEHVGAGCDPGEAAKLCPTLWVIAQQCVVTKRHGHHSGGKKEQTFSASKILIVGKYI